MAKTPKKPTSTAGKGKSLRERFKEKAKKESAVLRERTAKAIAAEKKEQTVRRADFILSRLGLGKLRKSAIVKRNPEAVLEAEQAIIEAKKKQKVKHQLLNRLLEPLLK